MLQKVQKTSDHWVELRRSKSYIADSFMPPFALRSGTLKDLFENNQAWREDPDSQEYQHWKEAVIESTSKLNFDAIVELALHLAFEAKLNDKHIWRAVENAALENLHLYELKHTCQL
jgi:hypothetical protein